MPTNKPLHQSMAVLHSWAGLIMAGLMYFIFVTGTFGYFQFELTRWLQPERPLAARQSGPDTFTFVTDSGTRISRSTPELIALAEHQLLQTATTDVVWWGVLLPELRHGNLWIEWQPPRQPDGRRPPREARFLAFNSDNQPYWVKPRPTGGGEALYRLHWRLHYLPETVAYWLVGLTTLLLLVGLITGVIVHRKLLAEFFTLRLFRQARSWLDLHNLVSVMALPFLLMISYSGLLFFMLTYLQPLIDWRYLDGGHVNESHAGNRRPTAIFEQQAFPSQPAPRKLSQPADQQPLHALYQQHHPATGAPVTQLYVLHPGDAHARVSLYLPHQTPVSHQHDPERIIIDGPTGERQPQDELPYSLTASTYDTLLELHEGTFAGPGTRLLYGLSGVLGCLMIASGVIFWLRKPRRHKPFPHRQNRLYAAIFLGLPTAIAAYFWANRLLPLSLPERANWEMHTLFITWLATLLIAQNGDARRCWSRLAQLAGYSWLLLPVVNALTSERHLWAALQAQDWVMGSIDLTMLLAGGSLLLAARCCGHPPHPGSLFSKLRLAP